MRLVAVLSLSGGVSPRDNCWSHFEPTEISMRRRIISPASCPFVERNSSNPLEADGVAAFDAILH